MTEDDTFRRLKRTPNDEMIRKWLNWWPSTTDKFGDFARRNDWTQQELIDLLQGRRRKE
jgi:hypothetical protein